MGRYGSWCLMRLQLRWRLKMSEGKEVGKRIGCAVKRDDESRITELSEC